MINWNATKEEHELITKIAQRAHNLLGADFMTTSMDVAAVHLNDVKLKLEDLLNADDFNFSHDIAGIYQHLDRESGKLQNCFLPRFSA